MTAKLGILAGRGDLPKKIVEHCLDANLPFHIIAFKDQSESDLVAGHPHDWVRLGAAGKSLKILKEQGVDTLIMAGQIKRPSMAALRPDSWALKFFAKTGKAAFGDDGLLKALIDTLEREEGFKVIGANDLLTDFTAPKGVLGIHHPDDLARSDLDKAFQIAHQIGELDIGQAVVVQDGLVIAVEAIEGTDEMLKRCLDLKREGPGGVLVKAKKPKQEERADLPSIGVTTLENAARAGLRGVGFEAHGTLIIDKKNVIAKADELGLFLYGLGSE